MKKSHFEIELNLKRWYARRGFGHHTLSRASRCHPYQHYTIYVMWP